MERDLGIEVSEVTFDQFERRKSPRGNSVFNEFRKNAYFADNVYKLGHVQMEIDPGIEVSEVTFDQFERRKAPRGNSI